MNSTLLAAGGALLGPLTPQQLLAAVDENDWTGYGEVGDYANSNGNTLEVMTAGHQLRSGSPIRSLRWWIAATLFASTIINYLDRQTLSWLAPYLKLQYHWTNTDYAYIVIAFRVAYTIGQTAFGRLMDRMGTRRGLTLPLPAWCWRIGQLAGGNEGSLRMVSKTRARPGHGVLRQRVVGRRRDCALHHSFHLLSLGMASGCNHPRRTRVRLDSFVAEDLPPPGNTPAYF